MCTCKKNTVWNHQTKVIFQILENDISEQSGDTSESHVILVENLCPVFSLKEFLLHRKESWISGWLKNQESHSMSELLHVYRLEQFQVFRSTKQE